MSEIIDAEIEVEEKPVIDQITQSLEDASKFFENKAPELAAALKEAAEKSKEIKGTAAVLEKDLKEAKRLSVSIKEGIEKINKWRGSQLIDRDF